MSTLHLHMKEWLDCIRDGGTPSCNVDQGRKVTWDPVQQKIV